MSVTRALGTAVAAALATVALALAPTQSAVAGQGPKPGPPPASATGPTVPRAAAPAAAFQQVRAAYTTADGVTHMSSYLAAPGVTAVQLYARLSAEGVKGLVAPRESVGGRAALNGACGYGTASNGNAVCPPYAWARNGFTNPQIYFHDTTGSSWPVGTVLGEWNNSPNIHAAWAPSGCPGTSGTHCVGVYEAKLGATGYLVIVYGNGDSAHHFIDGSVSVHFNDTYTSNHQAVACSGTGQSIGMGYNTSSSSCLYAYSPSATWPNSDDYNELLYQIYPR
jgi:hypothetical protein